MGGLAAIALLAGVLLLLISNTGVTTALARKAIDNFDKSIPAKIAFEDDRYIAIHDINPQAPVHLLIIPKRLIVTLNDLQPTDAELIGGMFLLAARLMSQFGHKDYRTVFNCGEQAGQSVFHIHLHVLAGRPMNWPPG